jgi:ABC-2 type transport system ATP-binding protein
LVIAVRGLRKTFGQRVAVDGVSFDVLPGVVTGFLGPNGAGKSTTMRLMLGLDQGAGRTHFDGRPLSAYPHPLRQVGALLDAKAFHPGRAARDHLRMVAVAAGVPRARADECLEFVGLGPVARSRPGTFSLGMAQRLGLAAALLGDPANLILDEPANGLDPHGVRWMRDMLRERAARGGSVLVSSHLLAEMATLAEHVIVIGRGRVVADEPLEKFLREHGTPTVSVRTPDARRFRAVLDSAGATTTLEQDGALAVTGMDQAWVGRLAFEAGVLVEELMTRTGSLEDSYLRLTGGLEEFAGEGGADW